MSMKSMPFESINLDPSVINQGSNQAETSDDGLDPMDFLSQSQAEMVRLHETDQDSSIELLTQTNENLDENKFLDLSLPPFSSSDVLFQSLDKLGDLHPVRLNRLNTPLEVLPLQHLLERQKALLRDMKSAVLLHKEILHDGEDCSDARTGIGRLFTLLSENALLLQEVYLNEASRADQALLIFQSWDKRRSRTLRRLHGIRSENNEYGAKLNGLLERRSAVDLEIDALESRLSSLRSNRLALNKEVGETMSVIESKSSKYVSLFRNLEKAGTDAVRLFLCRDELLEFGALPLLKYESVDMTILHGCKSVHCDFMPKVTSTQGSVMCSGADIGVQKDCAMGAQAFEVSETENPVKKNSIISLDDESAYELGYAKASAQLSSIKKNLSTLLPNWIQRPSNSSRNLSTNNGFADSLNTITQKLDIRPITESLKSKSEALEDLILQTAKTSKEFFEQGNAWSELSKSLDFKEQNIRYLLARSSGTVQAEVEAALIDIFSCLQTELTRDSLIEPLARDRAEDFCRALVIQELRTVAIAIDRLTRKTHYVPLTTSLDTGER